MLIIAILAVVLAGSASIHTGMGGVGMSRDSMGVMGSMSMECVGFTCTTVPNGGMTDQTCLDYCFLSGMLDQITNVPMASTITFVSVALLAFFGFGANVNERRSRFGIFSDAFGKAFLKRRLATVILRN